MKSNALLIISLLLLVYTIEKRLELKVTLPKNIDDKNVQKAFEKKHPQYQQLKKLLNDYKGHEDKIKFNVKNPTFENIHILPKNITEKEYRELVKPRDNVTIVEATVDFKPKKHGPKTIYINGGDCAEKKTIVSVLEPMKKITYTKDVTYTHQVYTSEPDTKIA